ncbi:MAG: CBS domain-containing protein [Acidimicrobiales bacterium]
MRTVRDVMQSDIDVLRTTDSAADAARLLAAGGEDSIPLCLSDGRLAGSVSNRDIVARVVALGLDPRQVSLSEFAQPDDTLALDVDATVDEAASVMCRHQRSHLPVLQDDRVVGVVTRRDAARSLAFRPPWDGT